jgi:hypothetical protein
MIWAEFYLRPFTFKSGRDSHYFPVFSMKLHPIFARIGAGHSPVVSDRHDVIMVKPASHLLWYFMWPRWPFIFFHPAPYGSCRTIRLTVRAAAWLTGEPTVPERTFSFLMAKNRAGSLILTYRLAATVSETSVPVSS